MVPRTSLALTPVVFVVLAVSLIVQLGRLALLEPDEARYTEVSREMIETGEYLVPQLDYETRINKPALYHWILTASLQLIPPMRYAVRLPSVLAALGVLALVGWFARRYLDHAAAPAVAMVVLGSSLLFWWMARTGMVDIFLCLSITALLMLLFAWDQGERKSLRLLLAAAVVAAIGVNLKGPVAVALSITIFFGYAYALGELRAVWKAAPWGRLLVVVVLLSLPWFVLVTWRLGQEAAEFFFIDELIGRFFSAGLKRSRSTFFYIPVFLGVLAPWSLVLVRWLIGWGRQAWRHGLRTWARQDRVRTFLLCWLILGFLFFSASSSKMVHYLLPLLPGAALLFAHAWCQLPRDTVSGIANGSWIALGVLGAAVIFVPATPPWLSLLCAVAAMVSIMFYLQRRTEELSPSALCLVGFLALLPNYLVVRGLSADGRIWRTDQRYASECVPWMFPGAEIYSIHEPTPSFSLFARRAVVDGGEWETILRFGRPGPFLVLGRTSTLLDLKHTMSEPPLDKLHLDCDVVSFGERGLAYNNAFAAQCLSATAAILPPRDGIRLAVLGAGPVSSPQVHTIARALTLYPELDGVLVLGGRITRSDLDRHQPLSMFRSAYEWPFNRLGENGRAVHLVLDSADRQFHEVTFDRVAVHYPAGQGCTFRIGSVSLFALPHLPSAPSLSWLQGELSRVETGWSLVLLPQALSQRSDGGALVAFLQAKRNLVVVSGAGEPYSRQSINDRLLAFTAGPSAPRQVQLVPEGIAPVTPAPAEGRFLLLEFSADAVRYWGLSTRGEILDSGTLTAS